MAEGQTDLKFSSAADVEELRKQLEDLQTGEPSTTDNNLATPKQRTTFTPGAQLVVFEGGKSDADLVHFMPYSGEKHGHHRRRRSSQAALVPSRSALSAEDYVHQEFVKQFCNQIELVNIAYDKEEHGKLRATGRFGKLYYFDDPPEKRMTVKILSGYNKKFERGQRNFRSTFIPQALSHGTVESYLLEEKYKLDSEEERIMITLNIPGSNLACTIVQNFEFEFQEFRYPDFKWILFNVVRKEKQHRDVRMSVESLRETEQQHDPAVLSYKDAKIVSRNNSGYLAIDRKYSGQVSFIREKTVRRYKKTGVDGGLAPEVELVRSREYSFTTRSGVVSEEIKDWREEVVIHPELPDLEDVAATKEFAKRFIEFCYVVENLR